MSAVSRLINQFRCWGSYALSVCGVQSVHHLPVFVSVEPADFCQLACPECPVGMGRGKGKGSVMGLEDFRHVVRQVSPYVHTIQLFWQGEPLLNLQLPEMIRIAREAGLYTIVSTNAQRLDSAMAKALAQAGLNRIIVSMDGWTQATYEQYRRGGSVEKVKDAVRYLRDAKMSTGNRQLSIELQCLYLRTNEAEWGIFRKEYKSLGADRLAMKTAQLYDYEHGSPMMPSDTRYARYRYDDGLGAFVLKRKLRNRCYRLWSGCVIDVHGDVFPCCYDKGRRYPLGNILRQPLREIFHGEKARGFRRQILSGRSQVPVCTNCDE